MIKICLLIGAMFIVGCIVIDILDELFSKDDEEDDDSDTFEIIWLILLIGVLYVDLEL